jgi:hypothetical protein
LKEHCDQAGCQQGKEDISLFLHERSQADDNQHVQSDHGHSERPIHQRALDQHVDIPQAVAQECDANAEWNGQEVEPPKWLYCHSQERTRTAQRRKQGHGESEADREQEDGRESIDEPLDLLALQRGSHPPVAVDLRSERPTKHDEKPQGYEQWRPEVDLEGRVYRGEPEDEIHNPEADQCPRPARDEATIREGEEEKG